MRLFKCFKCGKLIEILHEGCPVLICCDEEMKEIKPNTVDASYEKHVPNIEKVDGKLIVRIGETMHPMDENHYIEWILVKSDNHFEKVVLKPGMEPVVTFELKNRATVYAYCNLHGLWSKEVE